VRTVEAQTLAQAKAQSNRPCLLLEVDWLDQTRYYAGRERIAGDPIRYDGNDYEHLVVSWGTLRWALNEEGGGGAIDSATISLSNSRQSGSRVSDLHESDTSGPAEGREVREYLAFLNKQGTVIGEPLLLFAGHIARVGEYGAISTLFTITIDPIGAKYDRELKSEVSASAWADADVEAIGTKIGLPFGDTGESKVPLVRVNGTPEQLTLTSASISASNAETGYEASNVVDGDNNTYWRTPKYSSTSSTEVGPLWLRVLLGESPDYEWHEVRKIRIRTTPSDHTADTDATGAAGRELASLLPPNFTIKMARGDYSQSGYFTKTGTWYEWTFPKGNFTNFIEFNFGEGPPYAIMALAHKDSSNVCAGIAEVEVYAGEDEYKFLAANRELDSISGVWAADRYISSERRIFHRMVPRNDPACSWGEKKPEFAIYWPAVVGSGYEPERALDGSPVTCFMPHPQSSSAALQYLPLTVDLGKPSWVDRIHLQASKAMYDGLSDTKAFFPKEYTILASNDASSWTTITSVQGTTEIESHEWVEFDVAPSQQYRFWRFRCDEDDFPAGRADYLKIGYGWDSYPTIGEYYTYRIGQFRLSKQAFKVGAETDGDGNTCTMVDFGRYDPVAIATSDAEHVSEVTERLQLGPYSKDVSSNKPEFEADDQNTDALEPWNGGWIVDHDLKDSISAGPAISDNSWSTDSGSDYGRQRITDLTGYSENDEWHVEYTMDADCWFTRVLIRDRGGAGFPKSVKFQYYDGSWHDIGYRYGRPLEDGGSWGGGFLEFILNDTDGSFKKGTKLAIYFKGHPGGSGSDCYSEIGDIRLCGKLETNTFSPVEEWDDGLNYPGDIDGTNDWYSGLPVSGNASEGALITPGSKAIFRAVTPSPLWPKGDITRVEIGATVQVRVLDPTGWMLLRWFHGPRQQGAGCGADFDSDQNLWGSWMATAWKTIGYKGIAAGGDDGWTEAEVAAAFDCTPDIAGYLKNWSALWNLGVELFWPMVLDGSSYDFDDALARLLDVWVEVTYRAPVPEYMESSTSHSISASVDGGIEVSGTAIGHPADIIEEILTGSAPFSGVPSANINSSSFATTKARLTALGADKAAGDAGRDGLTAWQTACRIAREFHCRLTWEAEEAVLNFVESTAPASELSLTRDNLRVGSLGFQPGEVENVANDVTYHYQRDWTLASGQSDSYQKTDSKTDSASITKYGTRTKDVYFDWVQDETVFGALRDLDFDDWKEQRDYVRLTALSSYAIEVQRSDVIDLTTIEWGMSGQKIEVLETAMTWPSSPEEVPAITLYGRRRD